MRTRRGLRFAYFGAILSVALAAGSAHAATIGLSFTASPNTFTPALEATRGWQFTVLQPVAVTSLGLWDLNQDGFADSHQVGLWDASSMLLAATTFSSGSGGTLQGVDGFRFLDLAAPVTLFPGTYRIGAAYLPDSTDQIAWEAGPVGAAGYVSYDGPRLSGAGPGFADPTGPSAAVGGAFGPNFQFEAVPEPAVLLLVGTGLLAAGARRRRV